MIILKKKIHLFFLARSQKNIKNSFLVYNVWNYLMFFITALTLWATTKKKLKVNFVFFFKISVPDFRVLKSALVNYFDVFKQLDLAIKFQFNIVKVVKKYYTVLRSPFVYKKSKEQFIIENVKSFFFFNFGEVNFFSVNFLCWFLKHFIYLSSSVKVLIKKCIFLK